MVVYPTLKFLRKLMVVADKIFGIKRHLQLSLCHLQCQVCDASCSNTGSCWCVKFIPDCIDIYLSVMTVKTVMRPQMLIKDANEIPSVRRNRKLLHVSKRSFFLNNLFQTKNWIQYLQKPQLDWISVNLNGNPHSAGLPPFHSVELLSANGDSTIDSSVYDD